MKSFKLTLLALALTVCSQGAFATMAVNYDDPSVAPAKSSAIHYKTLPCGMKVAISGYQAPIENTGRGTSGGKSNIVR